MLLGIPITEIIAKERVNHIVTVKAEFIGSHLLGAL